jgi:hypothetical protein
MAGLSELENFLKEQQAEGVLDSQGKFTLAREKALEKLAAFQLPRETAWVLKVVQAAVRCGAPELDIRQTSTDTEFRFRCPDSWTLETLDAALVDPENSEDLGLDHLKRGLWSVGINGLRPFHCSLPGADKALVWNGKDFHHPPCQVTADFHLTVSHRTVYEGKGLPLLRSIEAASGNAALARELREHAFTCPIPLNLDRRRLDALQLCPDHGYSKSSYPAYLALASGDLPDLPLPPGTFGGYSMPSGGHAQLNRVLHQVARPEQVAVAALISIHVEQVTENKRTFWKRHQRDHHFFWVRDGVVVSRQSLAGLRTSPVSLAIVASAEGLPSDLSAFSVVQNAETQARQRSVLQSIWPRLQQARIELKPLIESSQSGGRLGGGLLIGAGGLMILASPIHGLGFMGWGLYTLMRAGQDEVELENSLQEELERLQSQWQQKLLPSTSQPRSAWSW